MDGRPDATASPRPRVLLGLTGSVASVKWAELVLALQGHCEVKVVVSQAAEHFLKLSETYNFTAWAAVHALAPAVEVFRDADEWATYQRVKEDAVLHIELRKWADVFVIAPLSANSLAKLSHGLSDNLLTCVARAWDFSPSRGKTLLVAPAMNTCMWEHPLTAGQLGTLSGWGVRVVQPATKTLACGDTGTGAMAAVSDIAAAVLSALPMQVAPASEKTSSVGSAISDISSSTGLTSAAPCANEGTSSCVTIVSKVYRNVHGRVRSVIKSFFAAVAFATTASSS